MISGVMTDLPGAGEEAGRVDAVAKQVANVYEEEVEIAVNTLGETLQPIFTNLSGGLS